MQTKLTKELGLARSNFFFFYHGNFLKDDPERFWRYILEKKFVMNEMRVNDVVLYNQEEVASVSNVVFSICVSRCR